MPTNFFVLPAAVNQKSIPINAQSIPLSIVPDLMPNSIKSHKTSKSRMRAKRATFTFWVDKSSLKKQKMVNLASFWKPEACAQTVLPDRSLLIGQKLMKNDRIEKFKCDILSDF